MFSTQMQKFILFRKTVSLMVCLLLVLGSPATVFAQSQPQTILGLPPVGAPVTITTSFEPVIIKGINLSSENPFRINFILDKGDSNLNDDSFEKEANKVIKYFLTALTLPQDELWVNLSPYEETRIIPESFGQTEMGRDLLAQDYLLKQLTASLTDPNDTTGKAFWDRVYKKSQEQFGTTDVPVNTFNKVWIVPETANIYEHANGAFLVDNRLKVMLEEDYMALVNNQTSNSIASESIKDVSKQIVREILIPEIEWEVNNGKLFSNLRQIYNASLLANWYKSSLQSVNFGSEYFDQSRLAGVELEDGTIVKKIYDQYLKAFKVGVYDYVDEEYDAFTQELIPRRYFSGGAALKADVASDFSQEAVQTTVSRMKIPIILTAALNPLLSETPQGLPSAELGDNQQWVAPDASVQITLVAANLSKVVRTGLPLLADNRPTDFAVITNVSARYVNLNNYEIGDEISPFVNIADLAGRSVFLAPGQSMAVVFSKDVPGEIASQRGLIVYPYEINQAGGVVQVRQASGASVAVAKIRQGSDRVTVFPQGEGLVVGEVRRVRSGNPQDELLLNEGAQLTRDFEIKFDRQWVSDESPVRVTLVAGNIQKAQPKDLPRSRTDEGGEEAVDFVHLRNISKQIVNISQYQISNEAGRFWSIREVAGRDLVLNPGEEIRILLSDQVKENLAGKAIVVPFSLNSRTGGRISLRAQTGQLAAVVAMGPQSEDRVTVFGERNPTGLVEGRQRTFTVAQMNRLGVEHDLLQFATLVSPAAQGTPADALAAQAEADLSAEAPGGIDLNPAMAKTVIDGSWRRFEWHFRDEFNPFQGQYIDGMMHKTLNITPIPVQNLPALLGITPTEKPKRLSRLF